MTQFRIPFNRQLCAGWPVSIDVRPDTLNLDEALLEGLTTPRIRAIVARAREFHDPKLGRRSGRRRARYNLASVRRFH